MPFIHGFSTGLFSLVAETRRHCLIGLGCFYSTILLSQLSQQTQLFDVRVSKNAYEKIIKNFLRQKIFDEPKKCQKVEKVEFVEIIISVE